MENSNAITIGLINCNNFVKIASSEILEAGSYFIGYSFINTTDDNNLKFVIKINNTYYVESGITIDMNESFTIDFLVKGKGCFKFSPAWFKL